MKYSEVDILNFIEGQFNDQQTAEFLAEQRIDPELAAATAAMQASLVPIDRAYDQQGYPPVPNSLVDQLELLKSVSGPTEPHGNSTQKDGVASASATPISESGIEFKEIDQAELVTTQSAPASVSPEQRAASHRFMLAACLVSGVGVGALATHIISNNAQSVPAELVVQSSTQGVESKHHRLVKRIADYQSLYVENTVARLSETRITDANALLDTAAADNKLDYTVPDFTSFGYEFARAQELGFEGQTLVQLVYRKPGMTPLALCFMPDDGAEALPVNLSEHHQLNAASWVANHHHYVLVAEESNDVLKQMYNTATKAL